MNLKSTFIVSLICGVSFGLGFIAILLYIIGINPDWLGKITLIVISITAIAIATQAYHTNVLAKFAYMPKVAFAVMSGKTVMKKANIDDLNLEDELDTLFPTHNASNFPINFDIKISLEITDETKKILSHFSWSWTVEPEQTLFAHNNFLYNIVKEIGMDNIKDVNADIEYSYSSLSTSGLKISIKPRKWRFDLKTFEWIDPNGTRDSVNMSYDERIKRSFKK